jgi:hypothetical protein
MAEEYYSVLARTIAAAGQDHAQFRMMIYQFARTELRRDLFQRKGIRWAEMQQQMAALEGAIERMESEIGSDTKLLTFSSEGARDRRSADTAAVVHQNSTAALADDYQRDVLRPVVQLVPYAAERERRLPALSTAEPLFEPVRPTKPIRAAFWSTFRLTVAVILGVALFSAIENQGGLRGLIMQVGRDDVVSRRPIANQHPQNPVEATGNPPSAPIGAKESRFSLGPQMADVAIPNSYGVYAVNHGKLVDLQLLPIKVPDQRVSISAIISTPPGVTLPDGQLQFVAFRRDLAVSAPDQAAVRIVARVKRVLSFDAAGKAKTSNVDGSWAVRGNAYDMKVGPVNGNPEMIVMRPENPKFSFPAGRYALMLKGLAYDFSVDGPVTDAAQCLERTDALNAPVYSECRNP